jgi:hypothetical protein
VPEISRFFGIVIQMFWDEHPPPHIHVRYGGHVGAVEIDSGSVIAGRLPSRVCGLVAEWVDLHRSELLLDWDLVASGRQPRRIAPLE